MSYMFNQPLTLLSPDGRTIYCPGSPIYMVKSYGSVIEMTRDSAEAHGCYADSSSLDKEIWKLDEKGTHLVKASRNGHGQS